jgi:16S rRNA (adenine1518-N6/adenine1519-N6)-dimethyltransferase
MNESYPFYSIGRIREFLEENGAAPLKKWGQNFLIDPNIIDYIFNHIDKDALSNSESICEIGPGLGALTHRLPELNKKITLLEIDPALIKHLSNTYVSPDIKIIAGDALITLLTLETRKNYFLGNLPYYITSDILITLLKNFPDIQGGIFMVQKEFAERVSHEVSSFSIFARAFGEWKLLKHIKPTCFYPSPTAVSSLLRFVPYKEKILSLDQIEKLEIILRSFFWGKRKTIGKILNESPFMTNPIREKLQSTLQDKILKSRPQDLSFEIYYELARNC